MAKSRKKSKARTPQKQPQAEPKTTQHKAKSGGVWLWTLAGAVGTLVGVVADLRPRVVVSPPSALVDPKNVFDVSIDITNTGFLPLRDVGACLALGELVTAPAKLTPGFAFDLDSSKMSKLCRDIWQHHDLGSDERFTVSPRDLVSRASEADIAIVVTYRPWLLPVEREKIFRLFAAKDAEGRIFWRTWPLTEPRPK